MLLCPGLEQALPYSMVPQDRTIGGDGEVLLTLPANSPVVRAADRSGGGGLPDPVPEVTDVAPVAVPYRMRGRSGCPAG